LNEAHLFQSVYTNVLQPVIAQPIMIECISRVPSQENGIGEIIAQVGLRHVGLSALQRLCWRKKVRVESAPSQGDHMPVQASGQRPCHRATTCRCRHRGKGTVTGRPQGSPLLCYGFACRCRHRGKGTFLSFHAISRGVSPFV